MRTGMSLAKLIITGLAGLRFGADRLLHELPQFLHRPDARPQHGAVDRLRQEVVHSRRKSGLDVDVYFRRAAVFKPSGTG